MTSNKCSAVAVLAALSFSATACDNGSKLSSIPPPALHSKPSWEITISDHGHPMSGWAETIKSANPKDGDSVAIHLEKIQGQPDVPYTMIIVNRRDFQNHLAAFTICGHKIAGCSLATLNPDKKTWTVHDPSGQVSPLDSQVVTHLLLKPMKAYEQYCKIISCKTSP